MHAEGKQSLNLNARLKSKAVAPPKRRLEYSLFVALMVLINC